MQSLNQSINQSQRKSKRQVILKVENLSYSVKIREKGIFKKEKPILSGISFEMEKGSVLGIAGESGSGKTTLAKLIAGILKPTKGRVIVNTNSGRKKSTIQPVQILFQNNEDLINPLRNCYEIVYEASLLLHQDKETAKTETEHLFNQLNIPEKIKRQKGYELSGGERQRVALARILAVQPELLILDEPFSAQDVESQVNFLNLLQRIREEFEVSIICISHDLRVLEGIRIEYFIINEGKI
jgi:ABC-type dipeptide/oligopeptide/nickel transport system ATPase subunit